MLAAEGRSPASEQGGGQPSPGSRGRRVRGRAQVKDGPDAAPCSLRKKRESGCLASASAHSMAAPPASWPLSSCRPLPGLHFLLFPGQLPLGKHGRERSRLNITSPRPPLATLKDRSPHQPELPLQGFVFGHMCVVDMQCILFILIFHFSPLKSEFHKVHKGRRMSQGPQARNRGNLELASLRTIY